MNQPFCKDCKFGGKSHGDGKMECLRFPPQSIGELYRFSFPSVSNYDWCGEFKEKERAVE